MRHRLSPTGAFLVALVGLLAGIWAPAATAQRPSMNMGSPWADLDSVTAWNAGLANMVQTRWQIDRAVAAQQALMKATDRRCFRVVGDPRGPFPRFVGLAETNCGGPTVATASPGQPRLAPRPDRSVFGTITVTRDGWGMAPVGGIPSSPPGWGTPPSAGLQPGKGPTLGVLPQAVPKYSLGVDTRMPSLPQFPSGVKSSN